jgi:hypothetical protein
MSPLGAVAGAGGANSGELVAGLAGEVDAGWCWGS